MSETMGSVADLLQVDGAAGDRLLSAAGDGAAVQALPEPVREAVGGIGEQVAEGLREALGAPFADILGGAWSRYADLWKFCDRKAYPPDKVSVVTLAEHTITSTHQPYVDIELSAILPMPVRLRLDFQADVEAKIQGARLAIRDGKIRKLHAATVVFSGSLHCEGKQVLSREATLKIEKGISFGDGIPIRPGLELGEKVPIAAVEPAGAGDGQAG
ncbi:MAG TPA: hypothetical protein VEW03_00715 [Longimicrobiaceae bacterium]|nr:hypothetical protein [Longimicrobiaceae bacterium]